ncbi:hypothetical protein HNR42_003338 [Deinobacterium chartae]|uniref:Uncharacterized protein n=1 Tax=Deinobacterium chartae TaxID=521158 RepID=A0A841I5Z2_9DEIO|nr:hypothetical protein [Deinobacterium chartae]MBB6099878.1 hypothetical protein [Deinobacterium chartae]
MLERVHGRLWFTALALMLPLGLAQTTAPIGGQLPSSVALRVSGGPPSFDITAQNYPPAAFPARYPTSPLIVGVFFNSSERWEVQLTVPQLSSAHRPLPAGQLLYRVNNGEWNRASSAPTVIYQGVGPTGGWMDLKVEFALEVVGSETAGEISADAIFSAFTRP